MRKFQELILAWKIFLKTLEPNSGTENLKSERQTQSEIQKATKSDSLFRQTTKDIVQTLALYIQGRIDVKNGGRSPPSNVLLVHELLYSIFFVCVSLDVIDLSDLFWQRNSNETPSIPDDYRGGIPRVGNQNKCKVVYIFFFCTTFVNVSHMGRNCWMYLISESDWFVFLYFF